MAKAISSGVSLLVLARQNARKLPLKVRRVQAKLTDVQARRLSDFVRQVGEHAQVSINMRPVALLHFLREGGHQTVYEYAEQMSRLTGLSSVSILERRLGTYYPKRVLFDSAFRNGREFRYGALNLGGVGPLQYGKYCVVLDNAKILASRRIAYLMSDSLNSYIGAKVAVDLSRISQEVATHAARHLLAGLKFAARIPSINPTAWPAALCSKSDYMEAIVISEISRAAIKEIRIRDHDLSRYYREVFSDLGPRRSDFHSSFACVIKDIEVLRKKYRIPQVQVS